MRCRAEALGRVTYVLCFVVRLHAEAQNKPRSRSTRAVLRAAMRKLGPTSSAVRVSYPPPSVSFVLPVSLSCFDNVMHFCSALTIFYPAAGF